MNTLQTKMNEVASNFVTTVLGIIQTSSLKDLSFPAFEIPTTRDTLTEVLPLETQPLKQEEEKAPWEIEPVPQNNHRGRATSVEVSMAKQKVIEAAKKLPPGFQRGNIERIVGSDPKDLTRILNLLVASGQLKKKGERKATRYWIPTIKAAAKSSPQEAANAG